MKLIYFYQQFYGLIWFIVFLAAFYIIAKFTTVTIRRIQKNQAKKLINKRKHLRNAIIIFFCISSFYSYSQIPKEQTYRAFRLTVYVHNEKMVDGSVNALINFDHGNITTTSTVKNTRFFRIDSLDILSYETTYKETIPTVDAFLTGYGGIPWTMSFTHFNKVKDITLIVFFQDNLVIAFECLPTTEKIESDEIQNLPDHQFVDKQYTEKEIEEFFGMFGDPKLIESLWMYDLLMN